MVYYLAMTKTLNTKTAPAYTTDEGVSIPPHTLYRYTDEDGKGGCWYSKLEQAETSWQRWIASAPARSRRAAENARLEAAAAAHSAREHSDDPFARFDA